MTQSNCARKSGPYQSLYGLTLALRPGDASEGPRACRCGSRKGRIVADALETHPARVACVECGRHVGRLSIANLNALLGVSAVRISRRALA